MPDTLIAEIENIRKLAIIAMFSDDELMEMLLLKGGNAISFFYQTYSRSSIDLDFSLCSKLDVSKIEAIKEKIHTVLYKTFKENGYVIFDYTFEKRPRFRKAGMKDFWGGYRVTFKVIEYQKHAQYEDDLSKMRLYSQVVGRKGKKAFIIDFSIHEYCGKKIGKDLEGFTIYMYTPEMIIIEKIRAICQQMTEYPYGTKSARARDFFDIYVLIEKFKIDLLTEENIELFKLIFKAKDVPLELIANIHTYRGFHAKDFSSVIDTVKADFDLKDFDYYFDYVINKLKALEILWIK